MDLTRSTLIPTFFQPKLWLMTLCCIATLFASAATAQNISTIAGGPLVDKVATSADIPGPTSAIADASGNIYITAPYSYYMLEVTGTQLNIISGRGYHGFSGDGGPASKALIGAANGATFDSQGNLYFSDWGNNRIRKIDTSGIITTVAGDGQSCDRVKPCGDGGLATSAQLGNPQGVTVDASGNIFIADTSIERIREVDAATGIITTLAGTGLVCNGPNFKCGDGGPGPKAQLDLPTGIAVDNAGHVYVGDTKDQRIRMIDLNSGIITTVVGWKLAGRPCPAPTQKCGDGGPLNGVSFRNLRGIALDSTGKLLYIADSSDNRIRLANFTTGLMSTVVGTGVQGFAGDGGGVKKANLDSPNGISLTADGNLIISDTGNQRVRVVTHSIINTVAGGGLGHDQGPATKANLANPNAVVWAGTRHYYIADAANNRIREVVSGQISTAVGTGDMGWGGDGGAATSATLNNPLGVTVDSSGDIFIADTGNFVIREVVNGTITTIAGDGSTCFLEGGLICGDGGPATQAQLNSPTTTAVDANGNIYIADPVENRVRKVDTTGTINAFAGTGVPGFKGDNGPASQALLQHPYGVAVDASGNVYIADSYNSRIRCVLVVANGCGGSTEPVGDIVTFALNGKNSDTGDGGPALSASMERPFQVAFDPAGNLYIGGGVYQVVRKVDATTQHIITTVAGNILHPGKQGFAGDGGPATQAMLDNSGLSVDGNGNLLIADQGNNRIREVPLGTEKKK